MWLSEFRLNELSKYRADALTLEELEAMQTNNEAELEAIEEVGEAEPSAADKPSPRFIGLLPSCDFIEPAKPAVVMLTGPPIARLELEGGSSDSSDHAGPSTSGQNSPRKAGGGISKTSMKRAVKKKNQRPSAGRVPASTLRRPVALRTGLTSAVPPALLDALSPGRQSSASSFEPIQDNKEGSPPVVPTVASDDVPMGDSKDDNLDDDLSSGDLDLLGGLTLHGD